MLTQRFTMPTVRAEEAHVDAIQLIEKDHRDVERLFAAFERAHEQGNEGEQQRVVRQLVRALSVHAIIEEELVYPALREGGLVDGVLDALEEHHALKLTLRELDALTPANERFAAKVRVAEKLVREHVAEEERQLLPRLARELDAGARRELGESLRKAKIAAPTRPHPFAPDEPPTNYVAGAFAALFDRSRDALRAGADMLRAVAGRGAERGAQGVRETASRVRREGEGALRQARDRGREAARDAAERGWDAVEEARDRGRWALDRVEHRSAAAARTVRRRAAEATGATRSRKRRTGAGRRRRAGSRKTQ